MENRKPRIFKDRLIKKYLTMCLGLLLFIGCSVSGKNEDSDSNYVIAKIGPRVIKIKKQAIQDIGNWPKDSLEIITVNPNFPKVATNKEIFSPDQRVNYSLLENRSGWRKGNGGLSIGPRTWYEARFLPGKDGYFVAEFWEGYLPGRKFNEGEWSYGRQPAKDVLLLELDTVQFNGENKDTETHYGGWDLMSPYGWWKPLAPLNVSDMNHMYISKDGKALLLPAYLDTKKKDTMQLADLDRPNNRWKDIPKKSIDYSKYIPLSSWWEKDKSLYTVTDEPN